MGTALSIAGFELRTRLKRLSTWVYFVAFFALALLWTAAAGGAIANANIIFGSGKVWINSPYAISQTIAFLGMFALTVVAALAGLAVQQDFEHRTESRASRSASSAARSCPTSTPSGSAPPGSPRTSCRTSPCCCRTWCGSAACSSASPR